MAHSSQIDAAVVAFLAADTALAVLCPDGVWIDVTPDRARRAVIVSLADSEDELDFDGRAFETAYYLVKAIEFGLSGLNADAAIDRIDELFATGALVVAGFDVMATRRDGGRVTLNEPDDFDRGVRWQHRGARFLVQVSPQPAGVR